MKNALRIFGIQTSITNDQVKFVLLVTALESLLLTGSDRDYILWRLAEKTAFLLGKNGKDRRKVNDYVKLAYKKRSAFIHDAHARIDEKDRYKMENLVVPTFYKLMELREQGYVEIQKKEDVRNVEEYIEEMKFGNVHA